MTERNDPSSEQNAQSGTDGDARRVRAGDETGFARLYERLAPSLDAWADLRVKGSLRDYVEPEDVLQEIWWRAIDAFDRYEPERSSFRAWIFRIATNVLLEWNRKRRRKVRFEPSALAERAASLPDALARQATSVGRDLSRRESVSQLVAVVDGMSDEDRTVFIQCGLEGKTVAEAADVLSLGEDALKKRWYRLRERLACHPVWRAFDM